ncbi:DNA injection protein [Escherichia coli]|nr:DNA injection protein [Escherichia coli]
MAKAWKDVIASPQYQALAPEQKAQAQEQYFNEVVAPQAGENAEQAKQAFYSAYPRGLLEKGNIDIHNRPVVKNSDGSISTVRSMSTNIDGREVLIPTVSDDGRIMSDDEAIDNFMRTGKHLGMFDNPDDATAYAESLHNQQADEYLPGKNQATQQPVQQSTQAAPQQQGGFISDLGNAAAETGRGLVQAGVNVANIPASVADAVTSAAAWAGGKLGIGDGTYQPAPRVTTQGLEQDFGLQQGALTPQTTEGRVFAEALPYLTPVGVERAAAQAPTLAGRIAQGATRLLAENAVGSLAANSEKNDAGKLATDIGVGMLTGGAVNTVAKGLERGITAFKGDIAPEVAKKIATSESMGVTPMTSDVIPPKNAFTRGLTQDAEGALLGTGSKRAEQYAKRSQLVKKQLEKYGEYSPSVVVDDLYGSLKSRKDSAGRVIEDITTKMGDTPVDTSKSIKVIDNVLTRANRLGKVANKDLIRGLSDLREELAKPDIDFGLLRELRSALRESIQGDAMVFPNSAKAATDAVERAMVVDLRNNAARYLGAGEAARYVKANSDYSNVFNKVLNKRIANNLNKAKKEFTPELINSVVFSRKPSDIKRIWPALSEDGKNAMRAAYISKIAEKAGDSPTKFLTELNKLKSQSDGQIYNTIFSGRHMKELDALHEVLQQTARSDAANVVTQTGQSQANRIRTIGATATLGVSLGLEAGFGAIMRLYESKAARNALLRLANTKAGTPAYERALSNAANAIRPLLATEATQQ